MPKTNSKGKPVDQIEFWKKRIDTAVSEHYSVYVAHETLWRKINQIHEMIMDKHIPFGASVLDAGCAYGRWAAKFNNYLGIDFSPDFIENAKAKYPNKEFMVANLKKLPFKDKSFEWGLVVSIKNMIVTNCGQDEWDIMEKELKRTCKNVLILEYGDEKPGGGINGADQYTLL